MTARRVLFIGGTGVISGACVRAAVARGDEVTVLNRGSGRRPVPDGVRSIVADVRDTAAVHDAVGDAEFDVVAEFVAYTPDHVRDDLALFEGRTGQYVFISSASAYEKPVNGPALVESMPLRNPLWSYSRDKIACEDVLVGAHRDRGLPVTIVRPSHTYDETQLPTTGHWTDIARMRAGKPVIVHGDGTTRWTLTHADDFAVGFTALLGNPAALGQAFHITGDHAPTWNQIYGWLAAAAGVDEPQLVHVASETIARFAPDLGPGLLGDKAHSLVFDNSRITALAPDFRTTITFDEGARRILAHFDAHPEDQRVDARLDDVFDRIAAHAASAG